MSISLLEWIIQNMNIAFVSQIGMKTNSEHSLWVMTTVFYTTFITTQFCRFADDEIPQLLMLFYLFHDALSELLTGFQF
jgi:hypothetical protein